jgi:hypothetical protein
MGTIDEFWGYVFEKGGRERVVGAHLGRIWIPQTERALGVLPLTFSLWVVSLKKSMPTCYE